MQKQNLGRGDPCGRPIYHFDGRLLSFNELPKYRILGHPNIVPIGRRIIVLIGRSNIILDKRKVANLVADVVFNKPENSRYLLITNFLVIKF